MLWLDVSFDKSVDIVIQSFEKKTFDKFPWTSFFQSNFIISRWYQKKKLSPLIHYSIFSHNSLTFFMIPFYICYDFFYFVHNSLSHNLFKIWMNHQTKCSQQLLMNFDYFTKPLVTRKTFTLCLVWLLFVITEFHNPWTIKNRQIRISTKKSNMFSRQSW